tara:strand:- start:1954 stop:2220 length:267 start_codon:yes stop_codon:yes gene_type:complete
MERIDFPTSRMEIREYLTLLEREVNEFYSDRIGRVWIAYSRVSKGRGEYMLQVTIFPNGVDAPYRIITGQVDTQLTLEGVLEMIDGTL